MISNKNFFNNSKVLPVDKFSAFVFVGRRRIPTKMIVITYCFIVGLVGIFPYAAFTNTVVSSITMSDDILA